MKNWFKKRLDEASTYSGLGILAIAAMVFTKSPPEHIEAVTAMTSKVAAPMATGDYMEAFGIVAFGLMAIFKKEKS